MSDLSSLPTVFMSASLTTSHAAEYTKPSVLQPLPKRDVTILLLGGAGAGKTLFMSLLVKLFQGKGPLELEDENDPSKESESASASIQTVTTLDGYSIRILDTPDLADMDPLHINSVIQEFATSIDAVLILADGSGTRLGDVTDYTMSLVTSVFPQSMIENIGFVFTNTDIFTWDFRMDSLPNVFHQSKHWLIQNPLALHNNYRKQAEKGATENSLLVLHRKLEDGYDKTVKTLCEWLQWLDGRKPQPTEAINGLFHESLNIESHIEKEILIVKHSKDQQLKWKKIQLQLRDAKKHKSTLEDVRKELMDPYKHLEPSEKFNTICNMTGCYSNCHSPCNDRLLDTQPRMMFVWCRAFYMGTGRDSRTMTNAKCLVCHHTVRVHVRRKQTHEPKLKEDFVKAKEDIDKADTEGKKIIVARDTAEKNLRTINSKITQAQDEIRSLVQKYNAVSLGRNFAGHIMSTINMLNFHKEELKSKSHTDEDLKHIDETIAMFEQRMQVLSDSKVPLHPKFLIDSQVPVDSEVDLLHTFAMPGLTSNTREDTF